LPKVNAIIDLENTFPLSELFRELFFARCAMASH